MVLLEMLKGRRSKRRRRPAYKGAVSFVPPPATPNQRHAKILAKDSPASLLPARRNQCRDQNFGVADIGQASIQTLAHDTSQRPNFGMATGGHNPNSPKLTNDLVVEILSRLPARSVCRFKCVSRTWRDLISHSVHRKMLPQTLSGFFTGHYDDSETMGCVSRTWWDIISHSVLRFTNVSGRGLPLVSPSLDFLPIRTQIFPLDTCNGLLLCQSCPIWDTLDSFQYFVCNPATKEWAALPDSKLGRRWWRSCLGFNPAVSSHFYVFEFFECPPPLHNGVRVYSSETGERVHKEQNDIIPYEFGASVFMNGCLHYFINYHVIAVVDTQGKPRRTIPLPDNEDYNGFIQQSQGRLHYANFEEDEEHELTRLVVYVLEDYENQQWALKHTAEASDVLGFPCYLVRGDFEWVAIHPDCNMIFYTMEPDKTLMSYDMDRRQAEVICTLGPDTGEIYLPIDSTYSNSSSERAKNGRNFELELLKMLKGRRSKRRRCPAYRLTGDLVVEILSRLPARSVCRFKCVSTTWRDLISHPVHRKKLPQTLAGFFTKHDDDTKSVLWSVPRFTNVSGRGPPFVSPSLDFLPIHKRIFPMDTCNGLLICNCDPVGDMAEFHYFVCNPTTKGWVALPDSKLGHKRRASCLGFNPAVSPHFYVFEFFKDYEHFPPLVNGVQVYSSETGERVRKEDNDTIPFDSGLSSVFFNGCLHYLTNDLSIAVLDTQGKARRSIPVPGNEDCGFIQQSQGCLHYANFETDDEDELTRLVVYVLEDYENQRWKLKHTTEASYVLGLSCNLVGGTGGGL
ncbi:hypothetical protein QYE76_005115 [Lolium multiflorum]|uniref:F-box domain-containing protein n=1 Tax=Lolium multiflorum TaxID=4521 RepID=A0AAD8RSD7_LOLMU|nr:hypothetical protein QYE76_005115 [Lolium multiflorum]